MMKQTPGKLREAIASALIFGDEIAIPAPVKVASAGSLNDSQEETTEQFKQRLIYHLGQMMFVSGETAEPSPETTWMIEEIVREQVVEMVRRLRTGLRPARVANMSPTANSRNDPRQPPWIQIHLYRRPHLPNPPRQSQSLPPQNLFVLERRP